MKPLILAGVLLFSGTAVAANDILFGIDYSHNNLEIADEKSKPATVNLKAGYEVFDGIFVEASGSVASSDDNIYRMNFDIDQNYALFSRFESPESYGFSVDIQLGWSWTELAISGPEETYNGVDSYNGFAWGMGVNQSIPGFEQVKVRLGYIRHYAETDFELSSYTLGLSYSF